MSRKFSPILFLLVLVASWSCQSNDGKPETPAVTDADTSALSGIEQLKAQAVDENDIYGRLRATVSVLQDEFSKSEGLMPGLKKVAVDIDANCLLTISNSAFGEEVTRVNLQMLDPNGFSLIPDLNEGDFPGLRIQAIGGKSVVELLKKGTLVTTQSELVIYLADRPAIERITPYMLQALNICQGVQYPD